MCFEKLLCKTKKTKKGFYVIINNNFCTEGCKCSKAIQMEREREREKEREGHRVESRIFFNLVVICI